MLSRLSLFTIPLGVGLALLASAERGRACGNEVEARVDFRIALLANAERNTSEGRHRLALDALKIVLPKTGSEPTGDPLVDRAFALAALGVARVDGRYDLRGVETKGERGPSEALATALSLAEHFHRAKKDDSVAKTNFAEVLSHFPNRRGEAKRLLSELEEKDMMTSAYGYAALARLRADAGVGAPPWLSPALTALERAPQEVAKARCARMASVKEICAGERPQAAARADAPPPDGKKAPLPPHGQLDRH